MSSNQRPDTLMQDRIIQIDKSSCTARPDHTSGSFSTDPRGCVPPRVRFAPKADLRPGVTEDSLY